MPKGKAKQKAKPSYLNISSIVGDLIDAKDGLARMRAPERKKLVPIINALLRKQEAAQKKENAEDVSLHDLKELEKQGA